MKRVKNTKEALKELKKGNDVWLDERENVKLKLTCKNCGNTWAYGGKQEYYATCPRCLRKVKIPEAKK